MDSASRTDGIGVGVLCLTCLLVQLPGGWRQVLAVGPAHGKFGLGSFQWNLQERTFWTVASQFRR